MDANKSNQAKLPLSTNDFYITNNTLQTIHIRLDEFPVIFRPQDHDLWLEHRRKPTVDFVYTT